MDDFNNIFRSQQFLAHLPAFTKPQQFLAQISPQIETLASIARHQPTLTQLSLPTEFLAPFASHIKTLTQSSLQTELLASIAKQLLLVSNILPLEKLEKRKQNHLFGLAKTINAITQSGKTLPSQTSQLILHQKSIIKGFSSIPDEAYCKIANAPLSESSTDKVTALTEKVIDAFSDLELSNDNVSDSDVSNIIKNIQVDEKKTVTLNYIFTLLNLIFTFLMLLQNQQPDDQIAELTTIEIHELELLRQNGSYSEDTNKILESIEQEEQQQTLIFKDILKSLQNAESLQETLE